MRTKLEILESKLEGLWVGEPVLTNKQIAKAFAKVADDHYKNCYECVAETIGDLEEFGDDCVEEKIREYMFGGTDER
jgi:hypothetical protein